MQSTQWYTEDNINTPFKWLCDCFPLLSGLQIKHWKVKAPQLLIYSSTQTELMVISVHQQSSAYTCIWNKCWLHLNYIKLLKLVFHLIKMLCIEGYNSSTNIQIKKQLWVTEPRAFPDVGMEWHRAWPRDDILLRKARWDKSKTVSWLVLSKFGLWWNKLLRGRKSQMG